MKNNNQEFIQQFEDTLNKAKINAYSKQSLKEPLSSGGLKDFKDAVRGYYGLSDDDLNKVMGK